MPKFEFQHRTPVPNSQFEESETCKSGLDHFYTSPDSSNWLFGESDFESQILVFRDGVCHHYSATLLVQEIGCTEAPFYLGNNLKAQKFKTPRTQKCLCTVNIEGENVHEQKNPALRSHRDTTSFFSETGCVTTLIDPSFETKDLNLIDKGAQEENISSCEIKFRQLGRNLDHQCGFTARL